MQSPENIVPFCKGDEVFLARGTYEGTLGVFQNLREDPKWADILEPNSQIRAHPVEWLEHARLNPAAAANRPIA